MGDGCPTGRWECPRKLLPEVYLSCMALPPPDLQPCLVSSVGPNHDLCTTAKLLGYSKATRTTVGIICIGYKLFFRLMRTLCTCTFCIEGVSEGLLREMEVRLIAIDRPGYGFSDGNPAQTWKTAAYDIAKIADILELGDKFYLLGYSCGGAFCWAAARYIPERIAGIAMWAPVGSYWWKVRNLL